MADIFSVKKRSHIMSLIRSRDTRPEAALFSVLNLLVRSSSKVIRYAELNGICTDAFIPEYRIAIFCDGCFYHGCPKHGHLPKSNISYWRMKLARNVSRDKRVRRRLRKLGYAVWRVWEHDLRAMRKERTLRRLQLLLSRTKLKRQLAMQAMRLPKLIHV